jgi:hypothetical protein
MERPLCLEALLFVADQQPPLAVQTVHASSFWQPFLAKHPCPCAQGEPGSSGLLRSSTPESLPDSNPLAAGMVKTIPEADDRPLRSRSTETLRRYLSRAAHDFGPVLGSGSDGDMMTLMSLIYKRYFHLSPRLKRDREVRTLCKTRNHFYGVRA